MKSNSAKMTTQHKIWHCWQQHFNEYATFIKMLWIIFSLIIFYSTNVSNELGQWHWSAIGFPNTTHKTRQYHQTAARVRAFTITIANVQFFPHVRLRFLRCCCILMRRKTKILPSSAGETIAKNKHAKHVKIQRSWYFTFIVDRHQNLSQCQLEPLKMCWTGCHRWKCSVH